VTKTAATLRGAELFARNVHAETFEHVRHDLFGEGRIPQRIARAVEPHDKAVAHEVVAAHAVEIDEVADPDGAGGRRQRGEEQKCREREAADHLRYSVKDSRDSRAVIA
jgi:hypothetical protein